MKNVLVFIVNYFEESSQSMKQKQLKIFRRKSRLLSQKLFSSYSVQIEH